MTEPIRFLLNGERRTVADCDPNMTVLEYLRQVERKCGTKEGCAEGDCGACTVVLARPDGDGMRYEPVNSCIQLLPTLDGAQLITVEGLRQPDGSLHPVQDAMVACHGSQCGFCTPGFVMALFALWHRNKAPSREDALQALAGNLCRCTGYRPILDAAQEMYRDAPDADAFDRQAGATAAKLHALRRPKGLTYEADGKRFYAPRDVPELQSILARHPDAAILAGGTDFGLWITKQHRLFPCIVHLGQIEALKRIARSATHLEIGAAATWAACLPELAALYPTFGELLLRFASTQIRNVATIGGNIANASPIGDGPPPLMALGASIVLFGPGGEREIALEDFFTGYRKTDLCAGEIVTRIRVPLPAPDLKFAVWKVAKRFDQDISAVCGAFALRIIDGHVRSARIAYGGMAATPARAPSAEAALAGRPWTLATVQAAMAALDRDFAPLTDFRGTRDYRALVARNLLLRFHHETTGAAPARVTAYG